MAINSLCQRIELPASNVWNTPTTWHEDSSFVLPTGYTLDNAIQLVRGDYIYLIKAGSTLRGNLKTKTWDSSPIANTSHVICSACFYGPEMNNIFILGLTYDVYPTAYAHVYTLNVDNMQQTEVKQWAIARTSSNAGSSNTTPEANKKTIAIYDEAGEKVLFFVTSYVTSYDSENRDNYYNLQVRFCDFDISTNTITDQILANEAFDRTASRQNMAYFSAIRLSEDRSQILCSNPEGSPASTRFFNLQTKTFDTDTNSEIPYYASSTTQFGSKNIYFNNNTGIVYDILKNKIQRPAIPNTWVPPGRQTLNLHDGKIMYVGPTATYEMPYITKANSEKLVPVFRIRNGQRFVGEKPLTVYDASKETDPPTVKLEITTSWQTATKDIDILLGEYDTAEPYTLIIDQG